MEVQPTALLVDDDEGSLTALAEIVRSLGFEPHAVDSLAQAHERMDEEHFDVALIDLELPDGLGSELIETLESEHGAEVVVVTGHGTLETAVEAFRNGAVDFLTKPVQLPRLRTFLNKARRTVDLRREIKELRSELRRLGRFGSMVGTSPAMQNVYDLVERVAPTRSTVLIIGETGTGKELVAQTIHSLSPRAKQPFVDLNCGAVAESLIEAELFGHEKGAFTGATRSRAGIFERANGGTLLLDEITEMPLDLQVKLLRVLETGTLRRVGGDQQIEVDVRVIACTNRDPEQAVREKALREDLLYRLMVLPIVVPPLRDRGQDVEQIAKYYLDQLNREGGTMKRFADDALELISTYKWPGNVRELRNAVERTYILATEDSISSRWLPMSGSGLPTLAPASAPADAESPDGPGFNGKEGAREAGQIHVPIGSSIADMEYELIMNTLEHLKGDKRAAARVLGISLKTLYNRLNVYEAR